MPQYISPGVYVQERDLSQYVSNLSATIAAIVGTSDIGPSNVPTLVTSASQFVSLFGQPNPNHYMGYAALAYLKQGNQLYVTRVAPSSALNANLTVPVPATYTPYSGAWTLSSQTSTNATFTLTNTAATSATLAFDSTAKTVTWSGGNWIAAGVVPGSRLTFAGMSSGNNITVPVVSVTTTVITLPASTTGLVTETKSTGSFLLTDNQLVALQDAGYVLPGFLFNDLTQAVPAKTFLGSDLLSYSTSSSLANSYVVGKSFAVTSGAGNGSSAPVTAFSGINSTSVSMTVDATQFNSFNSPLTATATGSLVAKSTATTFDASVAGSTIVVLGATSATPTAGTITLKYSGVLATTTTPTIAVIDTYISTSNPNVTITIPLYYTGVAATATISAANAANNAVLISNVLTSIISALRAAPATPLLTNLAAAAPIAQASLNGIVGLGAVNAITGVSTGIRSAVVQSDGLTVVLSGIALGALGSYTLASTATGAFFSGTDVNITGNFSLNLSRPTWSIQTAASAFVPVLFKFSSIGQGNFSNIAITVDLNYKNVDASNNQQYTVSVYSRNTGLTVAAGSVFQSDFTLVEQFIGTPQVLQSSITANSVYVNLKLDYASADLTALNYTTGTVVTSGDYLTPSFGLTTDLSGQGVLSGTVNTVVGTTSYPSYSTFLFGGSTGSVVSKYDIIGNQANKTGIYSVSDPEALDINLLLAPGWSADPDVAKAMISLCVSRGDAMAILDTPFGLTVQNAILYKNNILNSASNYAAVYYPWVQIVDTNSKSNIFVPPSGMVAAQYAYNDSVGDVFTAPAGRNRGNLLDAVATERVLNLGDRDALTLAQINPIYSESGYGIYIRGQMTLQSATTALNRVNVRRLLLNLRKVIATASKYFEFEPGDSITALRLKQLAESTLDDRVRKGAIRSYTVDVGSDVNTAQVLENNQLQMVISIVPTKTAEIIVEVFNILPQGQGISINNA